MRILHFLKKELLQAIRAPESILLMVLFPLALTWLMGNAFSSLGSHTVELPELSFPVVAEESERLGMMEQLATEVSIDLELVTQEEALEKVKNREALGYIELDDKGAIYHRVDKAIRQSAEMNPYLTDTVLFLFTKIYMQQEAVFMEAAQGLHLDLLQSPMEADVTLLETEERSAPGSFDHYGVTMLTLILMYGSLQSMGMMAQEYQYHTLSRIKRSPLSISSLFFVKSTGAVLLTMMQGAVVMVVNHYVFGVNYGNSVMTFLYLVPHILFAVSLGIFAILVTKKEGTSVALLNIVIPILLVLGGAYSPIPDTGFLAVISRFSPVYWLNQGIFDMVYQGSSARIQVSLLFNFALAAILFFASYILFVREKGERFGSYH